jgi:hypothetical protein
MIKKISIIICCLSLIISLSSLYLSLNWFYKSKREKPYFSNNVECQENNIDTNNLSEPYLTMKDLLITCVWKELPSMGSGTIEPIFSSSSGEDNLTSKYECIYANGTTKYVTATIHKTIRDYSNCSYGGNYYKVEILNNSRK